MKELYGAIHSLELILAMINGVVFSIDSFTLFWDLASFAGMNSDSSLPKYLLVAIPFVITYVKIWI